jgi:hypothetical protein
MDLISPTSSTTCFVRNRNYLRDSTLPSLSILTINYPSTLHNSLRRRSPPSKQCNGLSDTSSKYHYALFRNTPRPRLALLSQTTKISSTFRQILRLGLSNNPVSSTHPSIIQVLRIPTPKPFELDKGPDPPLQARMPPSPTLPHPSNQPTSLPPLAECYLQRPTAKRSFLSPHAAAPRRPHRAGSCPRVWVRLRATSRHCPRQPR